MNSAPHTLTATLPRLTPLDFLRLQAQRVLADMKFRTRFISTFARRAMGLTQPRLFHPTAVAEGLTLVLPGIEAESIMTYGICDGLLDGGLPGAVRVFNWGLPFPGGYFANLTRIDRNRRRAQDLANEIVAYQDEFPGCPIHIVAHSGGCGIALFAAEALPPDRQIDSIVLLSGAVSPAYDLRLALARTRHGILNSYSPKDGLVLGLGTRLFGTTDRQFCEASGLVGFQRPAHVTAEEYSNLIQIRWSPDMARRCAHFGGHITSACEEYITQHITPWMMRIPDLV